MYEPYSSNANEIINGLWLGDAVSSLDTEFHKKNNITVVVNCTKNLQFSDDILYKYRISVHDNLHPEELINMIHYIKKILPVINEHMKNNRGILVHCAAGMQRSAIIVLAYLYVYNNNQNDDIFKFIELMRSKRPIVFTPMMNFKYSICKAVGILF